MKLNFKFNAQNMEESNIKTSFNKKNYSITRINSNYN